MALNIWLAAIYSIYTHHSSHIHHSSHYSSHVIYTFIHIFILLQQNLFINIVLSLLLLLLLLSGDIEVNPGPPPRRCRILFSNIRGLYKNSKDLAISSRDCDIVLCAETLVSSFRHNCELDLPGFAKPQLFLRGATAISRGLSVYIKNGYAAYRRSSYECKCHEYMVVRVCSKFHNFYVFNIYRNPSSNDTIYDCLINAMADIQQADPKSAFVFVGDFNAHHEEWLGSVSPTDAHGVAAMDFADISGCTQLVDGPTHTAGNRLDLVLTDVPDIVNVEICAPVGSSDHSSLKVSLELRQLNVITTSRREIYLKRNVDWDLVRTDVRDLPWHNILHSPDPIDALNNAFSEIIKRRVPVKSLVLRSGDKPWFNDECRRAHSEKQAAYHSWSRNRSPNNWQNFVNARSAAEATYRVAEQEHHSKLKDNLENATQPHKWWSSLKTAVFGVSPSIPPLLSSDGSLVSDHNKRARLLMSQFDSKQSRDTVALPPTCHPIASFTKFAFRSKELFIILHDLDEYGGTDPLGMFPLFLKKIADVLAPKLSIIFRKLIKLGSFPKCWRTANITPIPKGAASPNVANYRPISITPLLSKVYEKLLSSRLGRFFESGNVLPSNQFAYRKNLGTTDALLSISHILQEALECGHEARVVQIDFSAAFDRVNHSALLYKLRSVGVGGPVLSIISEFLSSRVQRVCVDGQYSDFCDVVSGVPQGSVLGPLLFILYTADLFSDVKSHLFSYADDTTLLSVVPSPSDRGLIAESINSDLDRIQQWCDMWDMRINCTKTQSMTFGRSRTLHPPHDPLTLNGSVLSESSSLRILGVLFDAKLTFEPHLRSISSSAAQKLGILRRANRIFDDASINVTCFRSFILPLLEYCAPVWSSAARSHLRLLDRVWAGARFLTGGAQFDCLWHRRAISSLCMLYKIRSNPDHFLHTYMPNIIPRVRDTRASRAAHPLSLVEVRCRTDQFFRCFIPSTVRLWNSLDRCVFDNTQSVTVFKSRANRFLING